MTSAADILAAARRYVGVPYRHRGRDMRGLDCVGLAIAVARDLGLPHPAHKLFYRPWPDCALLDTLLPQFCDPAPAPAAGVLVRLAHLGRPQHLGISTGAGTVLHVNGALGRVTESPLRPPAVVSCWRFRAAAA